MHIVRVAIENFRNFSSIDIDNLEPGLVLVGENGSGKSNFLHALRLVLDPSLSETSRQLVEEDFWDGSENPLTGDEVKVVVELTGFDEDAGVKSVLGEYLISTSPHRARLTFLYRPSPQLEGLPFSADGEYEVVIFGGTDESRRLGRSEWRYISLSLLPALRDAERALASQRSPLRKIVKRSAVDPVLMSDAVEGIEKATKPLTESDQLRGGC